MKYEYLKIKRGIKLKKTLIEKTNLLLFFSIRIPNR
jgi:hypothetical protein